MPKKCKKKVVFLRDGKCFLGEEISSDGGIHARRDYHNIRTVL
jgi:hypothetical protein